MFEDATIEAGEYDEELHAELRLHLQTWQEVLDLHAVSPFGFSGTLDSWQVMYGVFHR